MDAAVLLPPALRDLAPLAEASGAAWIVGGAPRDHLLHRPTRDLDLVVRSGACSLARRIANRLGADYFPLDADRDVGRVIFGPAEERWTLDLARLRGSEIADDLALRDFTVNALAVSLKDGTWTDPLGGAADLKAGRLRLCSPHAIRDDPIRSVRAVRFSLDLGLRIDPPTLQVIRSEAGELASVSAERLRDEVFRLFLLTSPSAALRLLDGLGGLRAVFPEVDALRGVEQPAPHSYNALDHTLAVVDGMRTVMECLGVVPAGEGAGDLLVGEARLLLGRFAPELRRHLQTTFGESRSLAALLFFEALYHDVGKAVTGSVDEHGSLRFLGHEAIGAEMAMERARALRLSGDEVRRIGVAIAQHMRPGHLEKAQPISRRSFYRYFKDCEPAAIDVMLLSLADLIGKTVPPVPPDRWRMRLSAVRQLLDAYHEHRAEYVEPPPLVNGDDLMDRLNLPAGPTLGRLLEAIREAQAAGEVTSRDGAFALAARLVDGLDASRSREAD